MEESGRHYVGQKTEETTKRKSVGSLRCTNLHIRVGNTGTDRETGGEDTDSRKQLSPKNILQACHDVSKQLSDTKVTAANTEAAFSLLLFTTCLCSVFKVCETQHILYLIAY